VTTDAFLKHRVAMVSGGLGDIGKAVALQMARHGARVALGDILPQTKANGLLRQLKAMGAKATYTQVDITDPKAITSWIGQIEKELGIATLVVPAAGIVTQADICLLQPEEWSRQLRVNLDGAFFLAQQAADRMIRHQSPGHIIFIGSWAAHAPHRSLAAYCVAKAGLRMLCECLALELAPHRILVNEVAPGYVDAGLTRRIWQQTHGLRGTLLSQVPLGQLIAPKDVAWQVVALCHPKNQHMTGSSVLMDGGLSLRR
jgi:glucose 1-dehydrogenase